MSLPGDAASTAGRVTKLYLVRHGETDWNREGRWQGQADPPLNRRGWRQARQLARRFKEIPLAAVFSSDLRRAACTAELIARAVGNPQVPLIYDPRLREIHQGEWQGLLVSEIQARYTRLFEQRLHDPLSVAPPGGETALQVHQRVVAAVADIRSLYPGCAVAIVSHGFAIAIIRVHYQRQPLERVWELVPENGTVIEMEVEV